MKKKKKINKNKFRVCELFAGVGGFHYALKKSGWKVVWSNQWEPNKNQQYAFDCYAKHFKKSINTNEDIAKAKLQLKKYKFELLVGGFPCQDYSVATTKAKGIQGKKGVLWWQINDIINEKKPKYILLENVDRLIRSPAKQRGRDFSIILGCLLENGYYVEWRVINAAEYGFPQKRRRTFIFATTNEKLINKLKVKTHPPIDVIGKYGFFAKPFPVLFEQNGKGTNPLKWDSIPVNIQEISDSFHFDYQNSGFMYAGKIHTIRVYPNRKKIKQQTLRRKLQENVSQEFYISEKDIHSKNGWVYCKGSKNEDRVTPEGYSYKYTEGAIPFPDNLDSPSRTMLTSEGNKRPNRITHIIIDPLTKQYRVLTPIETERLNGFPDNWTNNTRMPLRWRYFCMGNALVVGVVKKLGKRLKALISKSKNKG